MGDREGVAIVGMGCLFPGAPGSGTFWSNICDGVDALSDVPSQRWDPVFFDPDAGEDVTAGRRFYCRRGGFVDDVARVDPAAFGVMPVAASGGEPEQLLALAQAATALSDAGDPQARAPADRVAVVVGRGGYQTPGVARLAQRVAGSQQLVEALRALLPEVDGDRLEQVRDEFLHRVGPPPADSAVGLVPNLVASRIADRFDLGGPAYTVDAACASALVAVDHGIRELVEGRCDLAVVGAVHHCHDVTLWSVFTQLRALSPSQRIRPFHAEADGLLVGEGSAFFVLERQSDAERHGDRAYAVLRGSGVASDGRGRSLMSPDPAGQALAMERAWSASGLDPETADLVEAHGTGTPAGDEAELEALRLVFGKAPGTGARAGLGSVKSMIGHAMPAAGAAGLAKTALALHHRVLPPTLHADRPHPALADTRFRLVAEAEPWPVPRGRGRRAGVSAFGFGGINAHLVLEEAAPATPRPAPARGRIRGGTQGEEERLLLAGTDAADLARQLGTSDRELPVTPSGDPAVPPPGATGLPARLAVIGATPRRLELARRAVAQGQPWRGRDRVWFEPRGLLHGGGKLAALFPGIEPAFQPRVDDVADHFGLRELLGPLAAATADDAPLYDRARAVLAVGRLFHRALGELGVAPDVVAGHSLGEWAGELAAGIVRGGDVDALVERLDPASVPLVDAVFLAVGCSAARAVELADGLPYTSLSHDNCPHQAVMCGPAGEVTTLAERCRHHQVLARPLPFRSGFHSPLFAGHVDRLEAALGSLPVHPPALPLWSATTCAPYPEDPAAIRELSRRHLVEPVRFRELLGRLHDAGARVFVQMGPGGLCGFVDDTLSGRGAVALPTNVARREGMDQLHELAAALWVQGHDGVALDRLATGGPGAGGGPGRGPVRLDLGTRLVRDLAPLHGDRPRPSEAAPAPEPEPETEVERTQVIRRTLSLAEEPAWADHALVRQAADWPHPEDRFPVVPMTAMIEWLVEAATAIHPDLVPVAVEDVAAYRWLPVEPATTVVVRAVPLPVASGPAAAGEPDGGPATGPRVRASLDGHARATVVFGDAFPDPPDPPDPGEPGLTGERPSPLTARGLYEDRHLFHGPGYQGVRELVSVAEDGSRARLVALPAPGALLDAAGQLVGHWLAAATPASRVVLPTGADRIDLYGPHPAPGTELDATMRVVHDGATELRCDLTLHRAGRTWARVQGWRDRAFPTDAATFRTFQWPEYETVSAPADPGHGRVTVVSERWADSATRELIMRRYLGRDERAAYDRCTPLDQRSFLLERIAVKDAVRRWLWTHGHRDPEAGEPRPLFPAEIAVTDDEQSLPLVDGPFTADLRASLARAGQVAVAVAADTAHVGVDVEAVHPCRPAFEELALTAGEQQLERPGDLDRDTWLTCLWAVKEAAARAAGNPGLQGRPRQVEITGHAGGIATVDVTGLVEPPGTSTPRAPGEPGPAAGVPARLRALRVGFAPLPRPTDPAAPSPTEKEKDHVVAWTPVG